MPFGINLKPKEFSFESPYSVQQCRDKLTQLDLSYTRLLTEISSILTYDYVDNNFFVRLDPNYAPLKVQTNNITIYGEVHEIEEDRSLIRITITVYWLSLWNLYTAFILLFVFLCPSVIIFQQSGNAVCGIFSIGAIIFQALYILYVPSLFHTPVIDRIMLELKG